MAALLSLISSLLQNGTRYVLENDACFGRALGCFSWKVCEGVLAQPMPGIRHVCWCSIVCGAYSTDTHHVTLVKVAQSGFTFVLLNIPVLAWLFNTRGVLLDRSRIVVR